MKLPFRHPVAQVLNKVPGSWPYRAALRKLNTQELLYCLEHENRRGGLDLLRREAAMRGLALEGVPPWTEP